MVKWSSFLLLCALASIVLFAQEPPLENNDQTDRKWWPEFREVNPPEWKERGYDYYIWTPKDVYLVGDPITLYIERVLINPYYEHVYKDCPLTNPLGRLVDLLIHKEGYGFLSLESEEFPIGGDFSIFTWRSRGDFVPSEDEIDITRLHGNLKMPVRVRVGVKELNFWEVELRRGDCYVVKINDLTKLWKRWQADDPKFDERGVYRVQYGYSNIIEFEIR